MTKLDKVLRELEKAIKHEQAQLGRESERVKAAKNETDRLSLLALTCGHYGAERALRWVLRALRTLKEDEEANGS